MTLSDKELEELKIETARVNSDIQNYSLRVPGVVFPAQNHVSIISTPIDGQVRGIMVRDGQLVRQGQELHGKATPGQWLRGIAYDGEYTGPGDNPPGYLGDAYETGEILTKENLSIAAVLVCPDAAFIAWAHNNLPALLTALRGQDEENARLTESNFSLQRTLDKAINSLATVSAEAERLRAELARAVVLPCKDDCSNKGNHFICCGCERGSMLPGLYYPSPAASSAAMQQDDEKGGRE